MGATSTAVSFMSFADEVRELAGPCASPIDWPLTFVMVLLMAWYWCSLRRPASLPDGPIGLPIVGSLPFMDGDLKKSFARWAVKYGPVFSVQLGSQWSIVVSDYDIVKKIYASPLCTGRPEALVTTMSEMFSFRKGEPNAGIVLTDGTLWNEQRKFLVKWLHWRRKMTDYTQILNQEGQHFVERLRRLASQHDGRITSTDLLNLTMFSATDVIWRFFAGSSESLATATVQRVMENTDQFMRDESVVGGIIMMPWLRYVPYFGAKFAVNTENTREMRKLQVEAIERKVKSRATNPADAAHAKDFITSHLNETASTRSKTSSFFGEMGRLNLERCMTEVFGAGAESTSSLVAFIILAAIRWPEVGQKITIEIRRFRDANASRLPGRLDKDAMPYLQAVISETLRFFALIYTVPHATNAPMTIEVSNKQYTLPPKTAVYIDIHAIMHDANYWTWPNRFMPERFIDDNGKHTANERNVAFAVGQRVCPGRDMAIDEAFTFVAHLFAENTVRPNGQSSEEYDVRPKVGFQHRVPPFEFELAVSSSQSAAESGKASLCRFN